MKAVIRQQAHKEIDDAVDYYEFEQDELGMRMLDEFDRHVQWILQTGRQGLFGIREQPLKCRQRGVRVRLGVDALD